MNELDHALAARIEALAAALRARKLTLATAESCTGGRIAAACTSLAGSSDWFERGWVTYSNAAKSEDIAVPAALIAAHGAVSEPVARAMAEGARCRARSGVAVAVTGIAGPGGGSPDKPVGTVWLAVTSAAGTRAERLQLDGDRAEIRQATVERAIDAVLDVLAATR
jgi:nicotinamide-nucleotide amidase